MLQLQLLRRTDRWTSAVAYMSMHVVCCDTGLLGGRLGEWMDRYVDEACCQLVCMFIQQQLIIMTVLQAVAVGRGGACWKAGLIKL